MLEGIPWPIGLSVLGGGWLLVFIGVRMLFAGTLVTSREIDEKNRQIDNLTKTVETLNGDLRLVLGETVPAANAVMTALHKAAEVGSESPS